LFLCVGLAVASVVDVQIHPQRDGLVEVSMRNSQAEPVTLLVWNSPLDRHDDVFRANLFELRHYSGVNAIYAGVLIKRKPTLSDFMTMQPGQVVSTVLDLSKGYNFPVEGEYSGTLSTVFKTHVGELGETVSAENFAEELVSSEVFTIKVRQSAPLVWEIDNSTATDGLGNVVQYISCTTAQSDQVKTADGVASSQTSAVQTLMGKTCASGGTYVRWMGACDTARVSTVTSNFNKIASRISSGYRVDCSGKSPCSSNTYAYVYPSDANYIVYVCGAFWSASGNTCAFDSRGGTIVHEISHFTPVAATQDIQYGTSGCENLAKSNPANAVKNADSHEYLSETCPKS